MPVLVPELACQPSGRRGSRMGKLSALASACNAFAGVVRRHSTVRRAVGLKGARPDHRGQHYADQYQRASDQNMSRPSCSSLGLGSLTIASIPGLDLGACSGTITAMPESDCPTPPRDSVPHRRQAEARRRESPTATSLSSWSVSPRRAPWPPVAGWAAATRRTATARPSMPCANW